MKPAIISQKFHSYSAAILMAAVAAIYLLLYGELSETLPFKTDFGVGLASSVRWSMHPIAGMVLNIVLNLLIMTLMMALNKSYNVLRSVTWLPVGLFALMQAATPFGVLSLNSGTLVCLVVLLGLFIMFRSYGIPSDTKSVFLTFLLLSAGAVVQYCFLLFIPIFLIICAQMRIFNARSVLAAVFGLATVWIIMLNFGLIGLEDISFPVITSVFGMLDLDDTLYLLSAAGLTSLLLVVSIAMNIFKTMAYNARSRSFNGALTILSVISIIAMMIDYNNLFAYISLLNMCAAFQITHYFVNHRYDYQYLGVLAVVGIYILLYIWRIVI